MSIDPQKNWHRYPLPVTAAMLTPAYVPVITYTGGAKGDDVDTATSAATDNYAPRTQAAKAVLLGTTLAVDVARPRGALAPSDPYPVAGAPAPAAPVVSSLSPATAAAGSAPLIVTVTGTGFTAWSSVFTGAQTVPEQFRYLSPTSLRIMIDPRTAVAGSASVAVEDHDVMSNTDKLFTFT